MPRPPRPPLDQPAPPAPPAVPHGGYRHGVRGGSVKVTIRLSPDQLAQLDAYCASASTSRTEAIHAALALLLPSWAATPDTDPDAHPFDF